MSSWLKNALGKLKTDEGMTRKVQGMLLCQQRNLAKKHWIKYMIILQTVWVFFAHRVTFENQV